MGMFKMEKPRRFNHQYIYVDERKEKLQKMEENAKRDLGMLPPKEFSPEDIRGKFIEGTKHLKKREWTQAIDLWGFVYSYWYFTFYPALSGDRRIKFLMNHS